MQQLTLLGLTIQDFERQLVHILSQVDDFNILICRLKLEALLVDTSINGQGRCILFMNVFREMYPLDTASKALLQSIFSGLTADHVLEVCRNPQCSRSLKNNTIVAPDQYGKRDPLESA